MPNVGKLLGIPESRRTYEDSPKLALNKCMTGIEFECENVNAHLPDAEDWATEWKEDTDGSLRGRGREFILTDPLFGADLVQAIYSFCGWAKAQKHEANYRTGLHVHVDCRNLDANQLVSMVIYYAVYEKIIFQWVGDNRENSVFCLPFYKADGAVDAIGQALKAKDRLRDETAKIDRYGAFNLNALSKYGSVEWRHLQTTFDEERILKWVNIAQSFKKYAKHNPLRPWTLLEVLSKEGPQTLFYEIVGRSLGNELWYRDAESHVWEFGVPIANDLTALLDNAEVSKWNLGDGTLKPGLSRGFDAWRSKGKEQLKKIEGTANILEDPDLANNPELQQELQRQIYDVIRGALNGVRV